VNRDNALFLVIGLLGGFLAGYLLHESMAAVQPPRAGAAASGAPHAGVTTAPDDPNAPRMAEIERLRQVLERDPNDVDALIGLANLNYDIQNWERAKELYERFLALKPGDADALTDLGICLRALGDFQGALARFAAAQELAPAHWQSRFNEVIVRAFDLRDLAGAEAVLAELEKQSPGNQDVARLAAEVRRLKEPG
jgi:tetratricopeptide (TPR) repeat protein